MVLATADATGQPSGRHVLLKSWDERGFVFFTNYCSRKGAELAANPRASLVFPWFALSRQVVVVGSVERMTREETEAYFATRPRGSQLGAWASEHQSAVVGPVPSSTTPTARCRSASARTLRYPRRRSGAGCASCR